MSKYVVKGALREVKNYTKGYSDIQAKVRSATSNDPWGPSGTVMNEIAQATYNHQDFIEIMEMLDKRLNDSGKNWRHVFKALTVLDYCIHSGSDHIVEYARDNLYIVKTLREFQYIDEEGKDQGSNVRQKAKDITSLLSDPERLAQKRRVRNVMHDRITGVASNSEYPSVRGYSDNTSYTDEDRELQKAIEESKRTAQEHEKKMMRASEEDLRTAIQLSEKEKSENEANQRNQQHQRQNSFDFFASAPANQLPQQQSFDPFESLDSGRTGSNMVQQDLLGVGFGGGNDFGGGGGMNSFNPYQQQQQQSFGSNNFNVGTHPPTNHSTNPFGAAFGGTSVQSPPMGNVNNFGSAFDGGMPAKHMPHELASENAATRLASTARNSAQIDPFANLASTKCAPDASAHHSNNPFGATTGSDAFGGVMAPIGHTPALSAPATFPSGLPSGIRPNLVNLDALSNTTGGGNASSSPFANRNPFAASAGTSTLAGGTSNKKYDWTSSGGGGGGGGGTGPKPQRTLAELAATSSSSAAASPNMSGVRTGMTGIGSGGGMMSNNMGGTGMIGGATMYNPTGMAGGQVPSSQQNFFGQQQQQQQQQPGAYQAANSAMYGQSGMGMAGSFNTGGSPASGGARNNGSGNAFF